MDRYGEIYTTYQMILDGAAKAPNATILANGDSPLFNSTNVINPVKYYGFDTEKHVPELAHYNTEGILCPQCQNILKYKLNTYANLGDYVCENCSFHRPKLDYALTDLTKITNTTSEFVIDGQDYKINVGGLYNIYNALAAVSVAEFFGVSPEKSKLVLTRAVQSLDVKKPSKSVISHVLWFLSKTQLVLAKLLI